MLDYEQASIIKFTLDSAGNPAPYYSEVKENFIVPSIYFPSPEIVTDGDTLSSYRMRFRWKIKVFHKTTEDAYAVAMLVLSALKQARNLVPVIDEEGQPTNHFLRIQDSEIRELDSGAYLLQIEWHSRRAFYEEQPTYMREFFIKGWLNSPLYDEPQLTEEDIETAENAPEEE